MGPVWEANHVWLIFVMVLTWTAFPPVFAGIAAATGCRCRSPRSASSRAAPPGVPQGRARPVRRARSPSASLVTPVLPGRGRRGVALGRGWLGPPAILRRAAHHRAVRLPRRRLPDLGRPAGGRRRAVPRGTPCAPGAPSARSRSPGRPRLRAGGRRLPADRAVGGGRARLARPAVAASYLAVRVTAALAAAAVLWGAAARAASTSTRRPRPTPCCRSSWSPSRVGGLLLRALARLAVRPVPARPRIIARPSRPRRATFAAHPRPGDQMSLHEVGRRASRVEPGNEQSCSARLGVSCRRPVDLVRAFHAIN